jgi:SAM-dependent methyltransferase
MCTQNCLDWGAKNLTLDEIQGKRVLEIGSYDVNGSFRAGVSALQPAEYIGTDMREGPGVDIVCRAEELVERFGKNSFDVVITTSTFEHVRHWKPALSNMKHVCKPNGLILFTAPSHWPYHAYPNDFWRYQAEDIERIFSDFEILFLEEEVPPIADVYAKLRKPYRFIENDLSDYALYSIIADKRVKEIRTRDFFTLRFLLLSSLYVFDSFKIIPTLKYFLIYIAQGIKLKIVEPLMHYTKRF